MTGTNFGLTQGTSTVTFNGAAATPKSWNATAHPCTRTSRRDNRSVVVTVNGQASNAVLFTVSTPVPTLTSLSPATGAVGQLIAIAGTKFGPTQSASTVTFLNGTAATPSSSECDRHPCAGAGRSDNRERGGHSQRPRQQRRALHRVHTGPDPYEPESGVGRGEQPQSPSQGRILVSLREPALSRSTGRRQRRRVGAARPSVAPVPSGATTGNVLVSVGGQSSNAVSFTVTQTVLVTATWNANTESNIAGYVISSGTQTGIYTTSVDVGNATTWQGPLTIGVGYYFAARAYNTSLQFSPYSAEVAFTSRIPRRSRRRP